MGVQQVTMPDLGEGLTESDLVEWSVAVGDRVTLNQVVADVETAKALVQLPSPYAGVVAELLVEPGTTVPVGAPIMSITVDEPSGIPTRHRPTPAKADNPAAPAPAPAPATAPTAAPERTSVLVGYGPLVEGSARPRRRQRSAAWSALHEVAPAGTRPGRDSSGSPRRARTFPPVRKLAHDLGIDLEQVQGSGPDGLITREDLLAHAPAAERTADAAPASGGATGQREVRTPITGVRKHTAAAMVASAFTAPQATEFLTVDVTPTLELLESFRGDRALAGHRITVLTLVAKAVLVALGRNPALNSRWDEDAQEIVEFGYVNLGIAAATPRGLVVPTIKDADRMRLPELADALSALTEAARAGKTSPADLAGGTVTITNIGVFGIDAGTPILVPGEAAIVATGAIRRLPWEHQGDIALRSVMTVSVSFDHRLVDGEQASRFLADLGAILARPGTVLAMV